MIRPALAAALVVAAACTKVDIDKPTPPDVSDLVAAYAEPTGAFTDSNGGEVVGTLDERLVAGSVLCGWDPAADLLCAGEPECPLAGCLGIEDGVEALEEAFGIAGSDAGPAEDAAPPRAADIVLRGRGFVRLHRICPGAGPEPVADERANGALDLVVGFSDRGLDPVVWGTAERCLVPALVPVRFESEIVLVFGDGPWNPARGISFLFRMTGEADLGDGGGGLEVASDFGLDLDQRELTVAVTIADGSRFVFFARPGATGFLAANGEWTCDFGARTCAAGADSVSW